MKTTVICVRVNTQNLATIQEYINQASGINPHTKSELINIAVSMLVSLLRKEGKIKQPFTSPNAATEFLDSTLKHASVEKIVELCEGQESESVSAPADISKEVDLILPEDEDDDDKLRELFSATTKPLTT